VSKEPYVVRKLTVALLVPLLVGVAWFAFLELVGFDIPTLFLVAVAVYVLVTAAANLERLRIDAKGIRVRPAGRVPWQHIQRVTYRGPHALGVKLKPDSPLPKACAA
jgi:hypothetical protein